MKWKKKNDGDWIIALEIYDVIKIQVGVTNRKHVTTSFQGLWDNILNYFLAERFNISLGVLRCQVNLVKCNSVLS